jgi:Sec-independent protein translocase protein TatA
MDLFSPRHLIIILVVVLLVFGTKNFADRLRPVPPSVASKVNE